MSLVEVHEYLNGPFKDVKGWCIPHLWQCIQPLRESHDRRGIQNPIAEIGVYHGKFFIGLMKTVGAKIANTAIDAFAQQQFNLDGAGEGNKTIFLANVTRAGGNADSIRIVEADSMMIDRCRMDDLRLASSGYSLFSVDGCHMAEHTINDVQIAMELTIPEGIIFVDDYYNAAWPGVQEGIAKLYFHQCPRFVPLLFTCNKLFLCHISFHKPYLALIAEHVRKNFKETVVRKVSRFGYDTLTVTPKYSSADHLKL